MINGHNVGIVIVTLALAGLTVGLSLRGCGMSAEQRRVYEAQLEDPSPVVRVAAADALLKDDPSRREVAYTAARAMLLMHWHLDARRLLERYVHDDDAEGLALLIRAYLDEAEALIDTADYQNLDLRQRDIEQLIEQAQRYLVHLAALDEVDVEPDMLEVRALHVRTALMRVLLEAAELELDQTEAARVVEEYVGQVAGTVGERRAALVQLQEDLDKAIAGAIERAPHSPAPWAFRFFQAMRQGDVEAARQHVAQMVQCPRIDRILAGQVATQLLTVEAMHGLPLTGAEIQQARQLLEHPGLSGHPDAHFILAEYYLAMADGRFEEAADIAEELDELRYPEAPALLAMARIDAGEAAQVLERIGPHREDNRRQDMRFVAARAWLAQGRPLHASGLLRGYVESHPQHLPARLTLAEAMEAADQLIEAGAHIEAAFQMSPTHPRALRLYVRLMVERGDDEALGRLLSRRLAARGFNPTLADEIAVVADVALDRVEQVTRWVGRDMEQAASDPLVHLLDAWATVPTSRRVQLSMVLLERYLDWMQQDPMWRVMAPTPVSIAWNQNHPDPPQNLDLHPEPGYLTYSRIAPMPAPAAASLVEHALDRWPEHARLIRLASHLALVVGEESRALAWHGQLPDEPTRLDRAVAAAADGRAREGWLQLRGSGESDRQCMAVLTIQLMAAMEAAAAAGTDDDQADVPGQADEAVHEALEEALGHYAWPHEPLAVAIAVAIEQDRQDHARALIERVRPANPTLAQLLESRLKLAVGRANEIIEPLAALRRDRQTPPLLRRWAADIECSAHVQLGNPDRAFSALSDLHADQSDYRERLELAMVDIWIEAAQAQNARGRVRALLRSGAMSSAGMDQLLARALVVMDSDELAQALRQLTSLRDDRALLRWYRADLAVMRGDVERAERLLADSAATAPYSPRITLALARLDRIQQRLDRAADRYRELYDRGGPSRLQAMIEMSAIAESVARDAGADRHGVVNPSGD